MAQTKHASIVSDSYLADFHSLYLTLYNLELMLISEYHSPKSIISLDLPERKLPLSNGGLNGVNQRFVSSIGNIEKAVWVFNCLGRPGRFWQY